MLCVLSTIKKLQNLRNSESGLQQNRHSSRTVVTHFARVPWQRPINHNMELYQPGPQEDLKIWEGKYTYSLYCSHFGSIEKTMLHKNRFIGTVLMIQLTRNSPTCAYIDQHLHKWKPRQWKPHYVGTRCTYISSFFPLRILIMKSINLEQQGPRRQGLCDLD